jgi:mannose-6-phosphate isomerase-like protein (cupin superfamily)
VTGHDKNGKSKFLMDGHAPNVKEMASMPGLALTDLWETADAPADNSGKADAARRPVKLEPPTRGSILRIVEFPPDSAWRGSADALKAFNSIGAGHAKDQSASDPMMHTTATVDYIIVLQGEIYAIMDTEETLLKTGDILIQRGTNHSWSVRGTEPCIVAAILIGAKPLGLAAKVRRKATAGKAVANKKAAPAKKAGAAKKPAPAVKKAVAKKKAAAKGRRRA